MARDMDFHRSRPNPINHDDERIFNTPPKPKAPKKPKNILWPIVITVVVVGAILTGLYFYYQSLQPAEVSSGSTATPTASASNASEELVVSVYDRGAGKSATATAASSLKSANLNVEQPDSATVTYTQSYIFYNAKHLTEAQKIVQTLPGYHFTLKETQLVGISVYLAKQ